jgi:hypothetical protein
MSNFLKHKIMKKNPRLPLFYFAVMAAVISSCSYSSYIPITVNEPMLKEKGEIQGIVYPGANHVEVQGAYAVTNHFAVQGDIWKGIDKRFSMDILPGYYYYHQNGFCLGVYAGGGMANTSGKKLIPYNSLINRAGEIYSQEVRYTSLILQPGIGYRHDIFEIGFSTRASYVDFSQYHRLYYTRDTEDDFVYKLKNEYHSDGFNMWMIQPAINASVGFKKVKAFFATSINFPIGIKGENGDFPHPGFQALLFSSGIKVDLMPCIKSRKKENKE